MLRIGGRGGRPSFATQFTAIQRSGVDLNALLPKFMAEVANPAGLDLTGLEDPITATVLPNLMRVGLVPKRHELGYLAQGWRVDAEKRTLEDLHTWHADTRAARAELASRGLTIAKPN